MKNNILKQIFCDRNQHWESFLKKCGERVRPVVIKKVERLHGYENLKNGFKLLVCEGCNDPRRVTYRFRNDFVRLVLLERVKNGVVYSRKVFSSESPSCDIYN